MSGVRSVTRVGVVGVGSIGRNHARIYASLPHAQLVAVWDINPAAAKEVAAKNRCHAAKSLEEFASMVDAASVATPTPTHYDIAIALMEAGVDVLVEKPITDDTSQ
ncbi:MAG: Gfo/Idh/MocA family oxidoreductase, partial [Verrucomicrobiia bacterium]